MRQDFKEVAHTGGKVTFTVQSDEEGNTGYSIGYSHSSPTPMTLTGIYAHPDGFACDNIKMGGIGDPWNPPPLPNCIAVMMASDTQGKFGHQCPQCSKHFRTSNIPSMCPLTCPYCGLRSKSFNFLTEAQIEYMRNYTAALLDGIAAVEPGQEIQIVIDMDKVADGTSTESDREFYYGSTTQQTEFNCGACGQYNDIRGRYGYCASCGTRNNLSSLEDSIASIRNDLTSGVLAPSDAVKRSISEFDSSLRDYLRQLATRVPMKQSRRDRLGKLLFHDLDKFTGLLKEYFGIDLLSGMRDKQAFLSMMFHRRHIYEHGGGVADERYISESHDDSVKEGDMVRETQENAHSLMGLLLKMTRIMDDDFLSIFPVEQFPIGLEQDRKARLSRAGT